MHTATKTIRLAACVALVWFLSGAFARAQTTDSTQARSFPSREAPSSRETEYQRWIPLDASQGKSQNPLELLARLQKRSKPTGNPFSWSQLQQAFQNNPGLSEQLQNLSPSQREQLKQLAQSFSQQAFPDGPPKSIDDLPPALRQQMESSPELRKLAEELARTQSSSGAPRGDDSTPGATSPELTEAELEKAVRDLFENKIESPNAPPQTAPREIQTHQAYRTRMGRTEGDETTTLTTLLVQREENRHLIPLRCTRCQSSSRGRTTRCTERIQ